MDTRVKPAYDGTASRAKPGHDDLQALGDG